MLSRHMYVEIPALFYLGKNQPAIRICCSGNVNFRNRINTVHGT